MSMVIKWRHLEYLKELGFSASHAEAGLKLYGAIMAAEIIDKLKIFMPVLAGPHALGVEVPDETVRFFCEVYALDSFREAGDKNFSTCSRFNVVEKSLNNKPAVVIRFKKHDHYFEVVGQPMPVEEQPEFQVTVVGDRLLGLSDDRMQTKRALVQKRQVSEEQSLSLAEALCALFHIEKSEDQTTTEAITNLLHTDENRLEKLISLPEISTNNVVSPQVDDSSVNQVATS